MTDQQRMKCLTVPTQKIDVVLDTDAYNEIDDQFAISYLLKSKERFHVRAICAAPFLNKRSESAKDGMEKSYKEIFKLLSLMGEKSPLRAGLRISKTDTAPTNTCWKLIKRRMRSIFVPHSRL